MKKRDEKASPSKSKNNPGRIDFMGKSKYFAVLSVVLTVIALGDIMWNGFNYGIDFAGGTEVQVKFDKPVETSRIREFTDQLGYSGASVQRFGEDNEYLIRLGVLSGKGDKEATQSADVAIQEVTQSIRTTFSEAGADIRRVDFVGPQIGNELKRNGILAAFYSLLLILIYVGLRFDYAFAPGAVFCLFHDAIITMGIFAVFNREVNVQTMAAILTIIGYSLNDTIVIFDRVRENMHLYRDESMTFIMNRSINDTLSRTLLTSLTTLLAVAAMYFLAGGVISDFSFTLAIGLVLGTYSTIYVAAPLVLLFERLQNKSAA